MLNIVEGGFQSGMREYLNERISEKINERRRIFLIVPEQQTLIAEAEASVSFPPSAPLQLEVTNFTRFANTVFRTLGGVAKNYCNGVKRSLVMWRALTELSPKLALTGGAKTVSPGTVERAMAALGDMQSLGIKAEELERAAGMLGEDEARLKRKLSDLAEISILYKKLLSEKYSDAGDDVDEAARRIKENPSFLENTVIFIDGFTSFTEPQYKLISLLSLYCEVSILFVMEKGDGFEYTAPRLARERISRDADFNEVKKKSVRIGRNTGVSSALDECRALLWHNGIPHSEPERLTENDSLRIYEAKTPYEECDFIAADIRKKVEGGARYRDFAIIARTADSYYGILDAALTDAGVPSFFSKRREAAAFEAVKLIYTAFSAALGNFKREDVISYAKCSPYGISREACDEFEIYTSTWQISGRKFLEEWNMNPSGYTVRRKKDTDKKLKSLNETRAAIISPLESFAKKTKKCRTVEDYAHALTEFLIDVRLEESIAARAEVLRSLGETNAAEENAALWKIICEALDTLVEVLGEAETDSDGFLAELKVVFAEAEVGRIPSAYDSVTVGSADMLRLSDKKHVYLMGVCRDEFPMSVTEGGYFSDRDRKCAGALGLNLKAETEAKGAQELYFFSRAFSYGKESVTLLYSTKNARFDNVTRADAVNRIVEMSGERVKIRKISELSPEELIYTPTRALEALGELSEESYEGTRQALCDVGLGERVSLAEGRIENDRHKLGREASSMLYGDELALTQTRIDSYNSCPLAYFCEYNLSLSAQERAEFDARNVGSFIHAILESFFRDVRKKKIDIATVDEETKEKTVKEKAEEYLESLDKNAAVHKNRDKIMLDRICRAAMPVVDGLIDEFRDSEFTPQYFELQIAKERPDLPTPAEYVSEDGKVTYVYGSIDRVDTYTDEDGTVFVRVVDYKTGKKVFSPYDIDEGRNLQMFLYLKSVVDTDNRQFLADMGVREGERPIPAGVIYLKTEIGDVNIDKPNSSDAREEILKAQKRLGMVLSEKPIIEAMNAKYVPVRFTKKGLINSRYEKNTFTREGWQSLSDRVRDSVLGTAGRMRNGEISPSARINPKAQGGCEYCQFKAFCRNVKI